MACVRTSNDPVVYTCSDSGSAAQKQNDLNAIPGNDFTWTEMGGTYLVYEPVEPTM